MSSFIAQELLNYAAHQQYIARDLYSYFHLQLSMLLQQNACPEYLLLGQWLCQIEHMAEWRHHRQMLQVIARRIPQSGRLQENLKVIWHQG